MAVVDAALDAVRPAMEAKEIKVETLIDSSLRLISGDADRLQQVVWNILSNAAKFTPAGGKIEIAVNQTNGGVQIQVKDSGPGIDPAFLPHVFERFRQADGSTTRTHGGLGLGLAIVRHLVELHGGTIAVENRENQHGAIFTVRLPLPSGDLHPETLANAAGSLKESRSGSSQSRRTANPDHRRRNRCTRFDRRGTDTARRESYGCLKRPGRTCRPRD